jgi:hypothetical protein
MFSLISKLAHKKMSLLFWMDLLLTILFFCGVLFWRTAFADKTVRNTGNATVSIRQFSDGAQLDIAPDEEVTTDNDTADYLLQMVVIPNLAHSDNTSITFEEI